LGSDALKENGKIFLMISSKGSFVVKLPKNRVEELIARREGQRFEPRPGGLIVDRSLRGSELAQACPGSVRIRETRRTAPIEKNVRCGAAQTF